MSTSNNEIELEGIETKSRLGFNVGVGADIFINEMFGIAPGISIETRGQVYEGSYEDDFGSYSVDGSANFLYLQIPVLAKVQFPAGPAMIQLLAGPELGFPLVKEIETTETIDGESENFKGDAELASLDFGLTFGAGLKFPVGAIGIFVEPSYYLGLTNSDDSGSDPETGEKGPEIMHRNFKLKLGIYKDL